MTEHLKRKHEIGSIADVEVLKALIRQCAIDQTDARILYMAHVDRQDQYFIADSMGLSVQAVRKRYTAALAKLHKLARLREML